jgi:hypothetical protein
VLKKIKDRIKSHGPAGNVFELNAKGWRKRGWFDWAYPAIGLGAMVPTDWCGFGCTFMNRAAIAACDWSGYEGKGTEDLWVIWNHWHPNGIRIAALPHCPASHVIRLKDKQGAVTYHLMDAFHEPSGECAGHLRRVARPWLGE